jgi:hypothetical protein
MPQLNNYMDVMKILPKTNCRQCGQATCLAFAVAVIKGDKKLADCPPLDRDIVDAYQPKTNNRPSVEDDAQKAYEAMQRQIQAMDILADAEKYGATVSEDQLVIKCLGKNFKVTTKGDIISDCHMNRWVAVPILSYLLSCRGKAVKGEWIPLRELKGGADWWRLFSQRCEKPLKKAIDDYTNLFEVMIDIFGAKPAPDMFDSDIAVIIEPLPKVPILICYWKSEDGMESSLNMFFDSTAEENLNIESIYTLGVGLTTMFEKIALTHGA